MTTQLSPSIDMAATIHLGSDRIPATIIQITHNGKRIVVQEDIATRIDQNGMSDSQEYTYARDLQGEWHIATLRKDGTYRIVHTKRLVSLGVRNKFYDFSF